MNTEISIPKVFISYSYSSIEHEKWVVEFADKLMSDGVNVILDKWELKEGQDKYVFMEKMVTDPTITKVLIICDKEYQEKADSRKGGVGTETLIISEDIYTKVEQEKFIPVIKEYKDDIPCLPVLLKTRIYIDLTTEQKYYDEYEKLLRSIYNQPLEKKPPLGTPPSHIFDSEPLRFRTSHKVSSFQDSVLKDKKISKGLLTDYLDTLLISLEDFRLETTENNTEFDERVLESITSFIPYRDEFIDLVDFICKYTEEDFYFEEIFEFLQNAIPFMYPPVKTTSWKPYWCDNYKFILNELFLYLIASMISNKRYLQTNIFLSDYYYFSTNSRPQKSSFVEFYHRIESLDIIRNRRLKLNRKSVVVDLIKERATLKSVSFMEIMQTDFILFIRSIVSSLEGQYPWNPTTLIYMWDGIPFDLFLKGQSRKFFNGIKILLDVDNKEELITKIQESDLERLFNQSFMRSGINLRELMNIENLDKG